MQRQQLRLGDLGDHRRASPAPVGGRRWAGRRTACAGSILARGLVAVHGRADDAPADAVARLREASQRGASDLWRREQGASGTRQSENARLDVTEARMDSLPWMSEEVKPGVPRSTRKPRMPSSARAHTTATSATLPLVIQVFSPFRIHAPSCRARVSIPAGFDPKPGSVSPKQPIASPDCSFGQPALLLLVAAVGQDRIHDQRALHADETAKAGIAALDFLHHQAVLDVVHAGAAVAFEVRAEEAEPPHLRDEFRGKARLAEAIADHRQHRSSTNWRAVWRTSSSCSEN